MKLRDFCLFEPMNELKSKMGIPKDKYGSFSVHGLTSYEMEKISSSDGLYITSSDLLDVLDDGTLSYKGSRVILYIRDVSSSGYANPKYHIANCDTLQNMRQGGRLERYVVSIQTNGVFSVNRIMGDVVHSKLVKLMVCQHCLNLLGFSNFNLSWPKKERLLFVEKFSATEFFAKYPVSLHGVLPKYNSIAAPLNNYSKDFDKISRQLREDHGWKCEKCQIDLTLPKYHKYLHVHHVDGQKNNNDISNLKVLCIECHSKEFNHSHIKNIQAYDEFIKWRGGL